MLLGGSNVNGLPKTELIRRRGPWRTAEDVDLATLEWVDWWKERRLHSACEEIPAAEPETSTPLTRLRPPRLESNNAAPPPVRTPLSLHQTQGSSQQRLGGEIVFKKLAPEVGLEPTTLRWRWRIRVGGVHYLILGENGCSLGRWRGSHLRRVGHDGYLASFAQTDPPAIDPCQRLDGQVSQRQGGGSCCTSRRTSR
jgi:hypothetical protein